MEDLVALEGFYPTREDAEKNKELLQDNGIEAVISEDKSGKIRPGYSIFTGSPSDDSYKMRFFTLSVKKEDVQKAQKVLKSIEEAPFLDFPEDNGEDSEKQ